MTVTLELFAVATMSDDVRGGVICVVSCGMIGDKTMCVSVVVEVDMSVGESLSALISDSVIVFVCVNVVIETGMNAAISINPAMSVGGYSFARYSLRGGARKNCMSGPSLYHCRRNRHVNPTDITN